MAQYLVPLVTAIIVVPFLLANGLAIGVIEFLRMFNPFFVVTYLPLAFVDSVIIGVGLVTMIVVTIVFWTMFFHEIGTFMFIPFMAWFASIFAWFIPIIGPVVSIMISLFPWLAVMTAAHWWMYI